MKMNMTRKEIKEKLEDIENSDLCNKYADTTVEIEDFDINEDEERVDYSCNVHSNQSSDYEHFGDCYVSFESIGLKLKE